MKILYTATVLSHICQFHLPHLQHLQEHGHTIHVAAHDNLSVKNGLTLKYADRFIEIPFQRSPKSPKNITALKQLKKLMREERYDLVICNTPMGGIVTRLAAIPFRKQGMKVVYIAHGFHFFKGASKKAWLIFYPIEKMMSTLCDTVITINHEDYTLAKKKFHTQVEHISGLGVSTERYHPADFETTEQLRRAAGFTKDDFVVLCTGELNQNKNQKTLISAAAALHSKIPNLRVLLAGNGPTEQELRTQIAALHLEDTVTLLGYRTDLENLVPAADLIVSCSLREGLGLNIIEAMLCCKPIVASANRGHRELVDDGVNGYLFPSQNTEVLIHKIYAIYSNPQSAQDMGRAGFNKVSAYTVDAVRNSLIPILVH